MIWEGPYTFSFNYNWVAHVHGEEQRCIEADPCQYL
jgi:hypothetical protein